LVEIERGRERTSQTSDFSSFLPRQAREPPPRTSPHHAPEIEAENGQVMRRYILPVHAHSMVQDGETVHAGDGLAKIPRETTNAQDITGDLHPTTQNPRRGDPGCRAWWSCSNKDPAVISEIDGTVKYGGAVKGQRRVLIVPDDALMEPKEYSIPHVLGEMDPQRHMPGSPARGLCALGWRGERDPGGLPPPGRQHQKHPTAHSPRRGDPV
jgi:hypothetical protein